MQQLEAVPLTGDYTYLITITSIIAMLALVSARVFFPQRFLLFLAIPIDLRFFSTKKNEHRLSYAFNAILFFFNALVVGMLVYLLIDSFEPTLIKSDFVLFFQTLVAFTCLILLKYVTEKLIANLFEIEGVVNDYLFFKFSYRHFLAIVIFPFCILAYFTSLVNTMALLIIASVCLVANVLFTLNFYRKKGGLLTQNFFYFILYICALEIAPYLILYKVLRMIN